MSITLTIYDETLMGSKMPRLKLEFPGSSITVRDLIRDRIYQEVQHYNQTQPDYFRGLVPPNDSEPGLQGYQRLSKHRPVDFEAHYEKALQVFERSGFMILVNACPVETLDTEIPLTHQPTISFLQTYLKVTGETEQSPVKQVGKTSVPQNSALLSLSHIFTAMTQHPLWAR
jgi:hypothetical protein